MRYLPLFFLTIFVSNAFADTAKVICRHAKDVTGDEQARALSEEIEKQGTRLISVSAPTATIDRSNGGIICVTVTLKSIQK